MEENLEALREKNRTLENKIFELTVDRESLQNKKYAMESEVRNLEEKNKTLLRIIENLSKGFANMRKENV
jgi:hypothetical protein